jgi:hypothetical protein
VRDRTDRRRFRERNGRWNHIRREIRVNHRRILSRATRAARLCLAAWLAGSAADALAVTVYKLTDNDGRITYSNEPPRSFSGTVVTLDIEATAAAVGAAEIPGVVPAARTRSENEKIIRGPSGPGDYSEIRLAEARLDEALKALEYARDNSSPDDWIYFVRNPRGKTRGPTPEYAERLERLDQSVKDAQTNLAEAEGRYRRSF